MFIIQGEGRGHISQAIAMQEILNNLGHEVVNIIFGKKPNRPVPDYIYNHFTNVTFIDSPYLIRDKFNRKTKMWKSLFVNIFKTPHYLRQLKAINNEIINNKPDLIFNFHEILSGFYKLFYKNSTPLISVARQYFYYHHRFRYPRMSILSMLALELVNFFTTIGSVKRFALNFNQHENLLKRNITVIPPLIRKKIKSVVRQSEGHYLIYLLNSGYMAEILKMHEENKETVKFVFWENHDKMADKNLSFLHLNEDVFIEKLKTCSAVITNAGFDLFAECLYLGIPVYIIPVKGNPEQLINAITSQKTNAALVLNYFDRKKFLKFLKNYKKNEGYINWINSAEGLIEFEIQKLIDKEIID